MTDDPAIFVTSDKYIRPEFHPASWAGLTLWLHRNCGLVSSWPSVTDNPTQCACRSNEINEEDWALLYTRIDNTKPGTGVTT